jgi:hypothetical protein
MGPRELSVRLAPRAECPHSGLAINRGQEMRVGWRSFVQFLAAIALAILTFAAPAHAQKVPDATMQELLIKSTLMTFNDANVTSNYTVLLAKMSKPFRDQFPPERLKEAFKDFSEKHINIAPIATKIPVPDMPANINDDGVLTLEGHFDTAPKKLKYILGYIMSDGEWKPIRLKVDLD